MRGLVLAVSLFRRFTGVFWTVFASPFPFSSAACTVSSLIDNDGIALPLMFLGWHRHTERARAFHCGMLVRLMLEDGEREESRWDATGPRFQKMNEGERG